MESPSPLVISADFLNADQTPATGLDLSEILFYVTRTYKNGTGEEVVADGEPASYEIDGVGVYCIRIPADLDMFNYFCAMR